MKTSRTDITSTTSKDGDEVSFQVITTGNHRDLAEKENRNLHRGKCMGEKSTVGVLVLSPSSFNITASSKSVCNTIATCDSKSESCNGIVPVNKKIIQYLHQSTAPQVETSSFLTKCDQSDANDELEMLKSSKVEEETMAKCQQEYMIEWQQLHTLYECITSSKCHKTTKEIRKAIKLINEEGNIFDVSPISDNHSTNSFDSELAENQRSLLEEEDVLQSPIMGHEAKMLVKCNKSLTDENKQLQSAVTKLLQEAEAARKEKDSVYMEAEAARKEKDVAYMENQELHGTVQRLESVITQLSNDARLARQEKDGANKQAQTSIMHASGLEWSISCLQRLIAKIEHEVVQRNAVSNRVTAELHGKLTETKESLASAHAKIESLEKGKHELCAMIDREVGSKNQATAQMNRALKKKMAAEQEKKAAIAAMNAAKGRLALQDNPQSAVGTRVAKRFENTWHFGTVVSFDEQHFWWRVEYEDEDTEGYHIGEFLEHSMAYKKKAAYKASMSKRKK